MGKKLSPKRQAFVTAYLKHGNATKAAIAAGYSAKTAKSNGSRLLTFADVREAVGTRLEKVGITAERVLDELGRIAFVSLQEKDLEEGVDDERDALLQAVRVPDKLKALELLGKHLKLFTEKVEHTGKDGEAIQFEQVDLSGLALDELRQLRELVAKTQRADAGRGDSSSESL